MVLPHSQHSCSLLLDPPSERLSVQVLRGEVSLPTPPSELRRKAVAVQLSFRQSVNAWEWRCVVAAWVLPPFLLEAL